MKAKLLILLILFQAKIGIAQYYTPTTGSSGTTSYDAELIGLGVLLVGIYVVEHEVKVHKANKNNNNNNSNYNNNINNNDNSNNIESHRINGISNNSSSNDNSKGENSVTIVYNFNFSDNCIRNSEDTYGFNITIKDITNDTVINTFYDFCNRSTAGNIIKRKIELSKEEFNLIKQDNIQITFEPESLQYTCGIASFFLDIDSQNELIASEFPSTNTVASSSAIPRPKLPAGLKVTKINFDDSKGNNNKILDADEHSEITFHLSDTGKGDAYNCTVQINDINNVNGIEYSKEQIIGNLASGEDTDITIPVSGTMELESGAANFEITIKEGNGFDANPFKISFPTQKFKNPQVAIADHSFTKDESEGQIALGQTATMKLIIQNQGQGIASNVHVQITNPHNVFPAGESEFSYSSLKPNESQIINYEFFANKEYSDTTIPFQVVTSESYGQYGETKTLSVSLEKSFAKTQEIEINAQPEEETQITHVSLTSDIDNYINSIKPVKANPNAFAVMIGNSNYQHTEKVTYAGNDALSMKNYLVNVLGYSPGNIFLINDATESDFNTYFGTKDDPHGKLYDNIKQGISDVFIYYSGHGAPGLNTHQGYFIPVDCDPQHVEQGGYSLDVFYANLAKLNAKSVTVVTDACFSGADHVIKNISAITISVVNPILNIPNCVVLSSSTGSQVSSWYNEKEHGLFTYFFLKAFQDITKSDENKDNKLTYKEIFDYVSDKTSGVPYYARSINGVEQMPTIQGTGQDNIMVEFK